MLIEVAEDVLEKALKRSDKEHEEAVEVLRHVALAIRRNSHLVFIPKLDEPMLDKFEGFLNRAEVKALRFSFAKKRNLREIQRHIRIWVVLSFSYESKVDDNIIRIKPDKENKIDLFEECHLLTENLIDSEFYQYVSLAFQKKNRIDECVFKTNFYPLQGGGITTKDVYLMECRLGQHFCLAILDSDKKWPNYRGYGQTASEFEKDYNEYLKNHTIPLVCEYYVMKDTCEIENLIPIQILKLFSTPQQQKFLRNFPNAFLFIDVKKGMDIKMLFDNDAFDEWKKIIPTEIDWIALDTVKKASLSDTEFAEKAASAGVVSPVKGWGNSILDRIIHPDKKHRNKYDLRKIDTSKLLTEQQTEWDEIGCLLFSWCCCFVCKNF